MTAPKRIVGRLSPALHARAEFRAVDERNFEGTGSVSCTRKFERDRLSLTRRSLSRNVFRKAHSQAGDIIHREIESRPRCRKLFRSSGRKLAPARCSRCCEPPFLAPSEKCTRGKFRRAIGRVRSLACRRRVARARADVSGVVQFRKPIRIYALSAESGGRWWRETAAVIAAVAGAIIDCERGFTTSDFLRDGNSSCEAKRGESGAKCAMRNRPIEFYRLDRSRDRFAIRYHYK